VNDATRMSIVNGAVRRAGYTPRQGVTSHRAGANMSHGARLFEEWKTDGEKGQQAVKHGLEDKPTHGDDSL
jgi:hypothetical protein